MTTNNQDQPDRTTAVSESTLEQFLQAVERKTNSHVHHRLLQACRQANPSGALDNELQAIVSEIINEA